MESRITRQGSSRNEAQLKPKSGKINLVIIIALLIFAAWAVFSWVNGEFANAKAEKALIVEQAALKDENDEIERLRLYSSDEYLKAYMEQIARDELGYANPNERIYKVGR